MEDVLPVEIIKKIIGHVDIWADLVNCRRINKKWNIFASELLKPLHPPITFTEGRLWEFVSCMEATFYDEIPFSKFHFQLDAFSVTENMVIFHHKYGSQVHELSFELREKRLTARHLETLRLAVDMTRHTPNLTCLQLNISCPILETEAAVLVNILTPSSLPNLRALKLYRDITTAKESDGRLTLLRALKNSAPHLEEISITPWKGTQLSRVRPVQRIFKDIRRMVLSNVTFLAYHPLDTEALQNSGYKLTQLDIRLNYDFDKAEQFHLSYDQIRTLFCHWLESHTDTLRTLKVILEGVSEIQIPTLRALTSLEVGLGAYDEVDVDTPLVRFQPAQFPNLRSVALNFYSEDWDIFSADEPFESVETLKLQGYQEAYVKLRWDFIFPNLKSLELICVKGDQLKVFLRHFSTIVHLKIQLSDYMTAIHGISTGSDNDEGGENKPNNSSSSLSSLTRLETLEISGCGPITLGKIVSITRSGVLKPLLNLSIDADTVSLEQLDTLKSVHRNVSLMTKK